MDTQAQQDERWREEHRRRRAAEGWAPPSVDAQVEAMKWTPEAEMTRNPNSALARALRAFQNDPEAQLAFQKQQAVDQVTTVEEVQTLRRTNRFASYAATRPSLYVEASYADLDGTNMAQKKALTWWRSGAKTLLLAGDTGRGKTHAAHAICNEVAANDRDGVTSTPVAVRSYAATAIRDLLRPKDVHEARDEVASGRRAREVRELTTVELLLIDDLTAGNVTPWFREEMHKIVDTRLSAPSTRTIITMNAPSREELIPYMVKEFGAAIVSRLRDHAIWAWYDGPDRRSFANFDPFGEG